MKVRDFRKIWGKRNIRFGVHMKEKNQTQLLIQD
jgi:hypothetical protein